LRRTIGFIDRTTSRAGAPGLAVKFTGIRNFGHRPHRHLCRKTKLLSHRLMAWVMQVGLPKGFRFPGGIPHQPTGGVGRFHCMPERIDLFGRGEQFDLRNQLHPQHCNTIVLKPQGLKLFLPAFFHGSLEGFRADLSSRTCRITFGPQRRLFAPILAAQAFKLLFQSARSHPLEPSDHFSRSRLWRCVHQQMHRFRHDLNGQNLKTGLRGEFRQPFFQSRLNRANQNPFTIAPYPNQMVIDDGRADWAMAGCLGHGPILAKECGSARWGVHPPKRSGFRREEL